MVGTRDGRGPDTVRRRAKLWLFYAAGPYASPPTMPSATRWRRSRRTLRPSAPRRPSMSIGTTGIGGPAAELHHDADVLVDMAFHGWRDTIGYETAVIGRCSWSRSTSTRVRRSSVPIGAATTCRQAGRALVPRNSVGPGWADVVFDFGLTHYTPVVGDWDGNGTAHPGRLRATAPGICATATQRRRADIAVDYGAPGDTPVVGDWDGDGTDTIGVYVGGDVVPPQQQHAGAAGRRRRATALPATRRSSATGTATAPTPSACTPAARVVPPQHQHAGGRPTSCVALRRPGDVPVVGDWDGNGTDTIGVYDGGWWYLRNSNTRRTAGRRGRATAPPATFPVAGDWDGNGTTPSACSWARPWYLRNTNTARRPTWRSPTARRAGRRWSATGTATAPPRSACSSGTGSWYLRNSNAAGAATSPFAYGGPGGRAGGGGLGRQRHRHHRRLDPATHWYLRNSNTPGPRRQRSATAPAGDPGGRGLGRQRHRHRRRVRGRLVVSAQQQHGWRAPDHGELRRCRLHTGGGRLGRQRHRHHRRVRRRLVVPPEQQRWWSASCGVQLRHTRETRRSSGAGQVRARELAS